MIACSKCKQKKPPEAFIGGQKGRNGRLMWCNACTRAAAHAWRCKKPSGYFSAGTAAWRQRNPEKHRVLVLLQGAKKRALAKALDFDLTKEWVIDRLESGVCEVTGLPFDFQSAVYRPSIDRLEPEKGYTEANCQMVIWAYNIAKFDFGHDALVEWVTAWQGRLEGVKNNCRRMIGDDSGG